jgi:MFS family permease
LALHDDNAMLRHPAMRAILAAEGISALGAQMSFLALPWFVLTTNHSATRMGIVLGAQVLPAALLGIPSAVVVQRLGVRRTLLVSDACRTALVAAVPLLHFAGLLSFPLLLAIVFAIGVFSAPYMSAQRLLIPETFADDESLVVKGNAILEAVIRLAMLLGPAAAGLAIMAFEAQNVLYLDALSYLVAFVILWRGLPPGAAGIGREPAEAELVSAAARIARGTRPRTAPMAAGAATADSGGMLAGARFAFAHPLLRRITMASFVFGFFFPPLLASLPVLTAQRYEGDSRVAGLLYAAMGLGALIGTFVVMQLATVPAMRLGAVGAVGLSVPLWLLVLELPAFQFGLVLFVSGLFTPILNAPVLTQIMLRAPEDVRTKVLTFVLTTNLLAGPLAYALTGPALDAWGLGPVYVIIACGVSMAAAIMVRIALRREPGEAPE